MEVMSLIISLFIVMLLSVLCSVLEWVWFKPKRLERCLRQQGFQGNSYRLLYGDTKDRESMLVEARSKPISQFSNHFLARVLPFFNHTLRNYGTRCFIWNGPVPLVNIAEPELMREVFMKIDKFQKPKSHPAISMLTTGLVQVEGHTWTKRRKLLNPAFHLEKLKLMLPAFFASSLDMVKEWEQMMSKTGSCEIEVWSYLHKLSADVISRAAFGSSYEEGKRIFELITKQILVVLPIVNSVYIPGWRFLPTRANIRMAEIDNEIRSLLKVIIDKRKITMNVGGEHNDDLLSILLESSLSENSDGKCNIHYTKLDIEEVIDECKIFYIAGQETTSTFLLWTLIMLGKHQEWQERAREEVLNTFGDEYNMDFHKLSQLKTVNLILQEVLRLYPPVTELSRTVTEDIKLGDVTLPAGVLVNLPILLVLHDEKIWGPDATEFKPERFQEGICQASGGNMSFFSFGWGPRICIGSNFAMTEAKMVLALILKRFTFELSPSYVHAPIILGTLQHQLGAFINFYRR